MFNSPKHEKPIFHRLIHLGINSEFNLTDERYVQVTNIASVLGALFMLCWMIIAICLTDAPIVYGSNGALAIAFLVAPLLNGYGMRVFAATWLMLSSFVSVFLFLYLLGYDSGVAFIFFLIIIMPYMTFPKKARKVAHSFSLLALVSLVLTVLLNAKIIAHYDVMEAYLLQVINISITGFICLMLVWSMSILIDESEESLIAEQQKSDALLHNILPVNIVKDLKDTGTTIPKRHNNISILFTDFAGFTQFVASISAITLVNELNDIFGRFDEIVEETGIEKIQTIGDAYVAACGLNDEDKDHAFKCIKAAKLMLAFLDERNRNNEIQWKMRVGIHSGSIVAGVVGKKKFSYDLFGDTINTASRMESNGEAGKINISEQTFQIVKDKVSTESRGKIYAKGKGEVEMYFVK